MPCDPSTQEPWRQHNQKFKAISGYRAKLKANLGMQNPVSNTQMKATNMSLYGIRGEKPKIMGCVHPGSLRREIVSFPFLVAGGCLHTWGGGLSFPLFFTPNSISILTSCFCGDIFIGLSVVIVSHLPW